MVNRIWPTAVAVKADSVSSVSASACHIGGPNSVNPGQILLVYGINPSFYSLNMNEKKIDCFDSLFLIKDGELRVVSVSQ